MTTVTSTPANMHQHAGPVIKTIAWVGLLAGTLDITAACINAFISRGTSPVIVLKYIAGGFFGKEAFTGGAGMAVVGLLFHYLIAYSFTAFFFLIYPSLKFLSKNAVLTAIVYGIFIYVVMDLIILPFTRVPKIVFHLDKALLATAILIVAIGLPLSVVAKRFYYPKK
jgi:hypothetical protein